MEAGGKIWHENTLRFSYRRILTIIYSRWYWLLAMVLLGLTLSYIYLNLTPKLYATEATLKFEEKRSEISELINVRNVYERSNKLQSEQFVIRSREVLLNAASSLNYPLAFYKQGYINHIELYPLIPFKVIVPKSPEGDLSIRDYRVTPTESDRFVLTFRHHDKHFKRTYRINRTLAIGNVEFMITDRFKPSQIGVHYNLHFNTPDELLTRINNGLAMTENKNTNILSFTQTDKNPAFAADILNAILKSYINYDQRQKTQSANQTISFIDTLQHRLAQVVGTSGTALERFKTSSKMINVSSVTNQALERLETSERQKADLDLQSLKTNLLVKQLASKDQSATISFDLQDLKDPFLSNLLTQYNALLLKKQGQLSTYKVGSETVADTEAQLRIIRQSLISNLEAQQRKNTEAKLFLQKQLARNGSDLTRLPNAEKDFVSLQSTFEVNQKVYAYLNQKKLEAQISRASITPATTIVNKAIAQFKPIAPIDRNVYKMAVLLGLLAGIMLIFLVRALNPYIFDRETLAQLTDIPIIGIIRKYPAALPSAEKLLLPQGDTMFAESVRSLRSNISFLAPDVERKVICITSETSGEGKSFNALNLAHALSLIDKRVIVIAADLRKSILHRAFNADNQLGLSNYLSNQAEIADIIIQHSDTLSFISGGPVPPNPSELLYGQRMSNLMATIKLTYDFIIIDSAPIGLVSDAMPMIKAADVNLFIIRAGVSRYHAAKVPERLSQELGLKNFHIILNAFNQDKLHSPYYRHNRYKDSEIPETLQGYLEGTGRKRWWQRIKSKTN